MLRRDFFHIKLRAISSLIIVALETKRFFELYCLIDLYEFLCTYLPTCGFRVVAADWSAISYVLPTQLQKVYRYLSEINSKLLPNQKHHFENQTETTKNTTCWEIAT